MGDVTHPNTENDLSRMFEQMSETGNKIFSYPDTWTDVFVLVAALLAGAILISYLVRLLRQIMGRR